MTKLNISQASKLYGKDRSSIQRKIKNGELSCEADENGHKQIDLSELIRIYGEPPKSDTGATLLQSGGVQQPDTPYATPHYEQEINFLEKQVKALEEDKKDLKTERDRLLDMLETEQKKTQTFMLEDRRNREEQPQQKPKSLSWLNATLIGCGIVITGALAFIAWVF